MKTIDEVKLEILKRYNEKRIAAGEKPVKSFSRQVESTIEVIHEAYMTALARVVNKKSQ